MFHHTKLQTALGIEIAVSSRMEEAIALWKEMYADNPPWLDEEKGQTTMGLPSAISSEIARLVTVEMKSTITGGARADYLNTQYQKVVKKCRNFTEDAAGHGGIVLKPYVSGKKVAVAVIQADEFYPTTYEDDEVTGGCFIETAFDDKYRYTRVEEHGFGDDGTYFIRNKCFRLQVSEISSTDDALGDEVPLDSVPAWAEITPEVNIGLLEKPLFSYFRMPQANHIEPKSPLGVACYSRAIRNIQKADKLWSEFLWEFEGGELAINASSNLFEKTITGQPIVPEGRERMFKDTFNFDDENFLQTFNPTFRDTSLFNGVNKVLQRIEFQCGLAYGTISDPAMIEKTATEIIHAKQRSYSTVHDIQNALECALNNLVYAIDAIATLYKLAPAGTFETTFEWDDSIVVDAEQERLRDRDEVRDGLMQKWEYRVKWYGETEDTAKKMVSQAEDEGKTDDEILGFLNEPNEGDGKE